MQGGVRLKKVFTLSLVVVALVAGAAFVACGGGGNKDKGGKDTPVAQETKEQGGESTPAAKATTGSSSGGDSQNSVEGVPVYPGATKTSSGEWSGSKAPIPAIGGGENPSSFGTVNYALYETNDGAETVYNWYKDKMSGWKEEWTYGGTSDGSWSGIGIWSKDSGKTAAWITVSEEGGKTSLTIMTGSQ
jgi:hypothetical protein